MTWPNSLNVETSRVASPKTANLYFTEIETLEMSMCLGGEKSRAHPSLEENASVGSLCANVGNLRQKQHRLAHRNCGIERAENMVSISRA